MRAGIVGAGSIAFATACLLEQMGHEAMLWSKDGRLYLLVSRCRRQELNEVAQYVRARTD